jgi:hypothetical protein
MHINMIESGIGELVDRIDMLAWFGAEDYVLGKLARVE